MPARAGQPLPPEDAARPADPADRLRGRLMAAALAGVLDQARGARDVLPHLAALERALVEHGAGATEKVPPHWLGRICSQLSSLPLPVSDAALQDLLGRLRDRLHAQQAEWLHSDTLESERTVVIREISHSEFAAAEVEQATTINCARI